VVVVSGLAVTNNEGVGNASVTNRILIFAKAWKIELKYSKNTSEINVQKQNVKKSIVQTSFSVPFDIKYEQHSS